MVRPILNWIYHDDCLKKMKQWPNKCIDLVVTDPPYGMKYKSNHYKNGNPFGQVLNDSSFSLEALHECQRLAKVAVLVFCRWDNLTTLPIPKSFIVWIKNNWTAGDLKHGYGRSWEGIAFYPQQNHEFVTRPHDSILCDRIPPTKLQHPTEKPVKLLKQLIAVHKAETVLDPFCGSGSTLIAAKELGKSFIGIELDEHFVDVAKKRVDIVEL